MPLPTQNAIPLPRRGTKKSYYALYIGGDRIKIIYVQNEMEFKLDQPKSAIAWVEEKKTGNLHYFLFKLGMRFGL